MGEHIVNNLGMSPTAGDEVLYFKWGKNRATGIDEWYVDDVLNAGNPQFEN